VLAQVKVPALAMETSPVLALELVPVWSQAKVLESAQV
jgi:hypothetical protein